MSLLRDCTTGKLLRDCATGKILRACSGDFPEGCYASTPCIYCEGGLTKRTPLRYGISMSVTNLGCVLVEQCGGDEGHADLGVTSLSGNIALPLATGCEWSRESIPGFSPLWTVAAYCSGVGCRAVPFDIYPSPVLTRISSTEFTLQMSITDSGSSVDFLDVDDITFTAANCRSVLAGTTNVRLAWGGVPPRTIVGTMSVTLTPNCL